MTTRSMMMTMTFHDEGERRKLLPLYFLETLIYESLELQQYRVK